MESIADSLKFVYVLYRYLSQKCPQNMCNHFMVNYGENHAQGGAIPVEMVTSSFSGDNSHEIE